MMLKMKKMLVLVCSLALLLSIIPISTASAHEVSTKSEAWTITLTKKMRDVMNH